MARTKAVRQTQTIETFTTAEQDTGKVWVDGRPIYRKVIRGQVTLSTSTVTTVAHGISGLTSAWELISFTAGVKIGAGSNNGSEVAVMHREMAGNWTWLTSFTTTNMSFASSYAWGSSYYTVIMEYVK